MRSKTFQVLAASSLAILLFAEGCQRSASVQDSQLASSTSSPSPSVPPATDTAAATSPTGNSNEGLVTEGTDLSGDKWAIYREESKRELKFSLGKENGEQTETIVPVEQDWELNVQPEGVFPFIGGSGGKMGDWLLLTSDPGAGQMLKSLYKLEENTGTWTFVADLSSVLDGYPTGIAFRDSLNGWIAATYHGTSDVPLFRTEDGGSHWALQEISTPEGFKYGNAFPPEFDLSDSRRGTLKIQFVNDDQRSTVEYTTADGGDTWIAS